MVDAVVVLLGVAAVVDGARRGVAVYATELAGFGLGLAVAFAIFEPVSGALNAWFGVPLGLAGFGTFVIALLVVHGAVQAALARRMAGLTRRLEPAAPRVRAGAGAVPALGTAAVLLAVVLSALVVLPGGGTRSAVLGSTLGRGITGNSRFLQPRVQRLLLPAEREAQPLAIPQVPPDAGQDAFYRLQLPEHTETQLDNAAEARMLTLVNRTRQQAGLRPLVADPLLQAAARGHSLDMYARRYFSHLTPDGKSPFDRMKAAGAHFVTAGENIAFAPDMEQAYQSLLASPDHRANLLNPDFRCIGIGAYRAPGYEEMFTQDFSDCS